MEKMWVVVLSRLAANAILMPLGDQVGSMPPNESFVNAMTFVPSAFITLISWPPNWFASLVNAIFVPSGDHVGSLKLCEMSPIRVTAPVPSGFITQIPFVPFRPLTNAILPFEAEALATIATMTTPKKQHCATTRPIASHATVNAAV
jgi:hypothetical protein